MPTNKPEVVLPTVPQAFFDEFGVNADDRVMDYGQACYEAGRAAQAKHHQQQVGHLPSDAVAWLDMGKGEAQLMFGKRDASNRANKRQLAMLFEKVNPGYHPLYLHPQAEDTLTRPATGDFVMVPREATREMVEAGVMFGDSPNKAAIIYQNMINAVPNPPLPRDFQSDGIERTSVAAPQQHEQEVVDGRLPEYARSHEGQRLYSLAYSRGRKKGREEAVAQPHQPAEAVAVDLERFREPVLFWHNHCYSALGTDSALRVRPEALRLLAIIDNAPPAIDIGKLRELVEPFICHNSSEQFIDIRVPTSAVTQLRALIGGGEKGNG